MTREELEAALVKYVHSCSRRHAPARIGEFAYYVGVSRQHLATAGRSLFGCTAHHLLQRIQLEVACALLRDSSVPIDDVSTLAGFGDRSTFFRVFRAAREVTPAKYRRTAKPNTP